MIPYHDTWERHAVDWDELCNIVEKVTNDSQFQTARSKDIRIIPSVPAGSIPPEIMQDTDQNTGLYAMVDGVPHAIGASAMTTLFTTALISGSALNRMSREALSNVLNHCLDVCRAQTSVLIRGGKIRAFLGTNSYQILSQAALLNVVQEALTAQFGGPEFVGGFVSHAMTEATLTLPEVKNELMAVYYQTVQNSILLNKYCRVMPCVRFVTSDTGASSASLSTFFSLDGKLDLVMPPVKVTHKTGKDGMDAFTANAFALYSQFKTTAQAMEAMDRVEILHGANCYKLLCKNLGIPKKYACVVEEDVFGKYSPDTIFTALDIYTAIMECVAEADRQGVEGVRLQQLKEIAARAATRNIKQYDLPGVHAW